MINTSEAEEKLYLEKIQAQLRAALEEIHYRVGQRARDIREHKNFLWENKTGMDHAEKISVRQAIDMSVLTGEAMQAKQRRIQKLLPSPYFGRVDFIEVGSQERAPIYIGLHAFFDEEQNMSLIHDWRAPVSTLFYDHETGSAFYESPRGRVSGEIVLKRQYRIRNGQMEFMLESSLNIQDDVLQKELSAASDERMKTIVATIQRDQNAVIRNEHSHVLIIQGVAGSGKTSIALHRVAFLLYRFKETLTSKDILIISPNKVFADYISNVLPELGEEKIPEMGMEGLAKELLGYKYKFQSFSTQVRRLLEDKDEALEVRTHVKSSLDFLKKLDAYIAHIESTYFHAADLSINGRLVPAWFIEDRFKAAGTMPVAPRLEKVILDVEHNVNRFYNYEIRGREREELRSAIRKMFHSVNLRTLYKDFYVWLGRPELCRFTKNVELEYADVFPFIYFKIRFEGIKEHAHVKHLIVDEMQDYTPVQYAVIAALFPCKKTILGDINQSIDPVSSSSSQDIQEVFKGADLVKLCQSYRSTYEITRFAQRILPNKELVAIERHGEEPVILCFKDEQEEVAAVREIIEKGRASAALSMGIVCKTQKQAADLYQKIHGHEYKAHLLTEQSQSFRQGIIVCSAHMAKGLEFDQVIVPQATDENYRTEMDRGLLYVACTRAMHKLTITFVNNSSRLIQ